MVLIEVLYQIKIQLIIDLSSRLQKHQTLESLTKVDLYAFFEISLFEIHE